MDGPCVHPERHVMMRVVEGPHQGEPQMAEITTIGLDLAKNVFQIHGIGMAGEAVIRRQLRRAEVLKFFASLPPCLVGMEACATAHHWAREITKLGHCVKLMPPAYVKPYVKRGKTDAADAEAICEAVTRPTMRFVAVKTVEQQAVLDAAQDPRPAGSAEDDADQRAAGPPRGVRNCCRERAKRA